MALYGTLNYPTTLSPASLNTIITKTTNNTTFDRLFPSSDAHLKSAHAKEVVCWAGSHVSHAALVQAGEVSSGRDRGVKGQEWAWQGIRAYTVMIQVNYTV